MSFECNCFPVLLKYMAKTSRVTKYNLIVSTSRRSYVGILKYNFYYLIWFDWVQLFFFLLQQFFLIFLHLLRALNQRNWTFSTVIKTNIISTNRLWLNLCRICTSYMLKLWNNVHFLTKLRYKNSCFYYQKRKIIDICLFAT